MADIFTDLILGEVHIPVARALDALAAPPHEAMADVHLCVLRMAGGRVVVGVAIAPPAPPVPTEPEHPDFNYVEDTEAVRLAARADAERQLALPA